MAFSLEGHVAIITGNSSGLGKEIGLALGEAGASVPVNFAHNATRAEETLVEYQQAGIKTCLVQADATSAEVEREAETAASTDRKAKPLVIGAADHRIGPATFFLPARAGVADPGLDGPFAGTGPQMQFVVVGWPHPQVGVVGSTGKACRGPKPGS